jgi:hypothetical protein
MDKTADRYFRRGSTLASAYGAVAGAVPHSPGSDRLEREARTVAMREVQQRRSRYARSLLVDLTDSPD